MIDLAHIEKYRENNRIEAKKALGGLPHSIWETYSAFANTLGGIILLGVEEYRDKTLHPVDLPDPEGMVREFWALVTDPGKASANVLSAKDVTVENVQGNHIVVISVPRADRTEMPVYVEGNPKNAYRRNGEGDYKCTPDELQAMYRDAAVRTQDMRLLEHTATGALNAESLRAYRACLKRLHPEPAWETPDDGAFLVKTGAAGIGEDGALHPTAAGLLMFGSERDIVREYPRYSLAFREEAGGGRREEGSILSSSGDWSGNVFDFYRRACGRLRPKPADVRAALREALANCLVHADYYGGGLEIVRRKGEVTMTNPGGFRIALAAAKSGGRSDPRNGAMQRLFGLIGVGEGDGSGIPSILRAWHAQGWAEPTITQQFDPDRTTLTLVLSPAAGEGTAADAGEKSVSAIRTAKRQMVIDYLTDHPSAGTAEIAAFVELSPSRVRACLAALIAEGIVVAAGEGRSRTYRLKA